MKEMIEKQMHELVMMAYKAGYEDGKDEAYKSPLPTQDAYNNGLHDAWECAKKILSVHGEGYSARDYEVFGVDDVFDLPASEAVKRLKEWENEQEKKEENKLHSTCKYYESYPFSAICKSCVGHDRWETKHDDEIKIGDEVVYVGGGINHNSKGVVIGVHENWAEVRFKTSWNCVGVHIDTLRKTYRHFPQIEEVLLAIKGGEKE